VPSRKIHHGHTACLQGFNLQDPEVDDVIRAARDLEAGCIEPDAKLTADDNVELLLRATRLLQLGLEVQYAEADALLGENNNLRDDLRVCGRPADSSAWQVARGSKHDLGVHQLCTAYLYSLLESVFIRIHHSSACILQGLEDQNRILEADVRELRELRDQEGMSADVKEMELELKVIKHKHHSS
jgi:hypothetical protein